MRGPPRRGGPLRVLSYLLLSIPLSPHIIMLYHCHHIFIIRVLSLLPYNISVIIITIIIIIITIMFNYHYYCYYHYHYYPGGGALSGLLCVCTMCVYIYIYIYIHTHTHTHTYTGIWGALSGQRPGPALEGDELPRAIILCSIKNIVVVVVVVYVYIYIYIYI